MTFRECVGNWIMCTVEAPVFPCDLSTQHTLVNIYWAITILQVYCCCSVAQSCLTSWPHGPHHLPEFAQVHVRFIWWCHPGISPSVALFFCFQSFPASGSFPMSQLFLSGGQSIGVSASASVLPVSIQGWFPLGLTGLIFLLSKGLLSLLQHPRSKVWILWHSAFFTVQLSHPYTTTGKTIALTRHIFVGKVMSLLCNTLSRVVIAFLPRSKRLFISWLQSPSAVILLLLLSRFSRVRLCATP